MKTFIQIQFAATLAVCLSIGGIGRSQTPEVSGQAGGKPSPEMAPTSAVASAGADPRSMPPAAAAFVYYFEIQEALAQDSLTNVAVNAVALANAVRRDTRGAFPAQLAAQADGLARDAVTLAGARLDFAVVSGQLMNYLKVNNPPTGIGPVHLVYDPVYTRLYWLQRGAAAQNPYVGKSGVPWKPLLPSSSPEEPQKLTGS